MSLAAHPVRFAHRYDLDRISAGLASHRGRIVTGTTTPLPALGYDALDRRPDYLRAFLDHLVNWEYVAEMYEAAVK